MVKSLAPHRFGFKSCWELFFMLGSHQAGLLKVGGSTKVLTGA